MVTSRRWFVGLLAALLLACLWSLPGGVLLEWSGRHLELGRRARDYVVASFFTSVFACLLGSYLGWWLTNRRYLGLLFGGLLAALMGAGGIVSLASLDPWAPELPTPIVPVSLVAGICGAWLGNRLARRTDFTPSKTTAISSKE